ncbi:cupin domain-containing protein [Lonsdalea quercina]|uniref:cupin domain-containing protein n=1 Tax=Lonsdalea quercina TaxID=71657 RepID=UPI00397618FB
MNNGSPVTLNLHTVLKNIETIAWEAHTTLGRKDARIFDIFHDDSGQRIALVHCAPGASAESHLHKGHETFLILDGIFEDDNGVYQAGDLICYAPGSQHAWRTPEGALIYAVWGDRVDTAVTDAAA